MITLLHRQITHGPLPPMHEPIPFPDPWPLPHRHLYLEITADGGLTAHHRGPRYLGRLAPWQPLRILVPLRGGIEDYYLLLQLGPRPAQLPPVITKDLT